MKVQKAVWASVLAMTVAVTLTAQAPKRSFEVGSVRPSGPSTPSSDPVVRVRPGGVFHPTHATIESLLVFAYDLRPYRIVGGPSWVRRDLFEINARAGYDAAADEIKLMVQSLLSDRFKLVIRREQREMRYAALVRARPNGPLGPKLVSLEECTPAIVNELRRKFPEKYPPPTGGGITGCGASTLADFLTLLGTPVIDATGLNGGVYYTLSYRAGADSDSNLPAISTALEEQLGLKLESRRGPVDVLVIESIQPPTGN